MNKNSESSVALYRKYRPQNFDEVIDQDHIVETLKSSINSGRISHAYLFHGGRGTGKTSIARIFAKEIGTSPNDLYEIDAASNRGIDDIRELREGVSVLPFESKYKVYIIDEAHMLTKEAFNALLKTLEEPPAHALFILATTELEKLPETIISRCEVHAFKKPGRTTLRDTVLSISKKEGFAMEKPAAELIALLGDGSFRDTQGILQKVLSGAEEKKISLADVERLGGAPKRQLVNRFIESLDSGKPEAGLKALSEAAASNIDMKVFSKLLLERVRFILLLKFAKEMEEGIKEEVSEEDFAFLKAIAAKADSKINSKTVIELLDASNRIGYSYLPELPLELVLIKFSEQ